MSEAVTIDYTNWRGERSKRLIRPVRIEFTENEFHQGRQWLLFAVDLDKQLPRTFALSKIHSWSEHMK